MQARIVSEPTLKRLPLYHRFLKELQTAGRETVSCTDIGRDLDLDPTQVRKDLESVGIVGRPRIGYFLVKVIDGLEQFLGWKNTNDAFLVGAGSMGSALLGYHKFEQCGLKIVTAFDLDPSKIGTRIHGKHVLPLRQTAGPGPAHARPDRHHHRAGFGSPGRGRSDDRGRHSRDLEFCPVAPARSGAHHRS